MRRFRFILGISLFCLIAGAVLAQKAERSYDHKAPWRSYRTFTWIRQPDVDDPGLNDQVASVVAGQLQAHGLQLVTDNADLGVMVNGATDNRHTVESFYGNTRDWKWQRWDDETEQVVTTYPIGSLVIDLFDGRTKRLVWRGYAEDMFSKKPEKNLEKMNKAVAKLFEDFPPK